MNVRRYLEFSAGKRGKSEGLLLRLRLIGPRSVRIIVARESLHYDSIPRSQADGPTSEMIVGINTASTAKEHESYHRQTRGSYSALGSNVPHVL